jgi:hypothetical protein
MLAAVPMPKQEHNTNRHSLRVWIKWALEARLFEKLPPHYDRGGANSGQSTIVYARALLAELRNPNSSKRTIKEMIADAGEFRAWVGARQKDCRRLVLREAGSQRSTETMPAGATHLAVTSSSTFSNQQFKLTPARPSRANPRSNPMWDDWLDT